MADGAAASFSSAFLLFMVAAFVAGNSFEDSLYDSFFKGGIYNPVTRPTENSHNAICVQMGIVLEEIVDLSMKSQSMTTVVVLTMKWNDFRLKWNETSFNGTKVINLPPSLIWKPDIALYNKAEEKTDERMSNNINVEYTGDCVWVQQHKFTSTCDVDVTNFPFDKQICSLRFGSWTLGQEQMKLNHLARTTQEGSYFSPSYTSGGDWQVDNIVERPLTRKHSYSSVVYAQMSYDFHVTHRPNYYILYMILPCIVISILILMVFIIPPDAGERIGLGITVLLNMSVYLLVVADHLPQTSEKSPLLGIFYVSVMYEIAWAFIASIINLYLYYKKTEPPNWLCQLFRVKKQQQNAAETEIYSTGFNDMRMNVVRRRRTVIEHHANGATKPNSAQPGAEKGGEKEGEAGDVLTAWQVIGRTLDFICFWFFCALFISTTVAIIFLKPNV